MTTANNLRKILHRKAWESVTSAPVVTNAGAFVVNDNYNMLDRIGAVFVAGASSIYLYLASEDAWVQLPNSGIAGTFAAGACGSLRALGAMGGVFTQTATAGTTTTITTNKTIIKSLAGCRIRVVAGTGIGYDSTITSNTLEANAVLTVPVNGVAFDATTQYQIYSGSLWFMNAGTSAVGFSVYDFATGAWTARSVTNLPTAWGTDAKLVSTMGSAASIAIGTATAGGASTLTNSTKSWATNMWANYQIRITAGTGIGQIRTIASNTGTVITTSAAWTTNPNATSVYRIEGNDDYFYLLGNAAVAMYRFSVSGNAWTVLAPTAARSSAPGAGVTGNWIDGVSEWDGIETALAHYSTTIFKQNGRYIYSFRGGASNALDVYDIAANTWISGVTYANRQETFTTGSSAADLNGTIYINKEATGRIFGFSVNANRLDPIATNTNQSQLGGNAVAGDKIFIHPYVDGATQINFLYAIRNSSSDMMRMLII